MGIMEAQSSKKQRGKPFAKGQSGNPGGRAKKTDEERSLEQLCRDKTPDALKTILDIMTSGQQEKNQLSAAQYIIDRGWGKAVAQTETTIKGDSNSPLNMILQVVGVGSSK